MGFPKPVDARLTAPLTLPAEPDKPLTTQDGSTLADGSGNALLAGVLSLPGGAGNAPGCHWTNTDFAPDASSGVGIGLDASYNTIINGDGELHFLKAGVMVFRVTAPGSVQPNMAGTISSGTGAPTIAGTAGDYYLRTDTPTVTDQRIYVCTVTGGAGAATWVGIV